MSLQLLNNYTSSNLGDAAIYETIAQLAGSAGVANQRPPSEWRYVRGLRRADELPAASAYVSVGGDIFNNARPWLATRRFVQNLWELQRHPARCTFLFGQTIPDSCRGVAFALLSRTLRSLASVTVRDEPSLTRLRAAKVGATLSFDLAFAYRPGVDAETAGRALLSAAGVDGARSVLMSVRGFDRMYPHDNRLFLARMAELAQRLAARGHQPCLLVHSQAGGADYDHAAAALLRQAVPALKVLDPFALPAPWHPLDALIGVLALARGALAVRYHTAVLRLLMGRMPYSLHYSVKGADLARRLRLPGMPLEAFDPAATMAAIEDSFECSFDASPLATDVRESFGSAWAAARGEASVADCRSAAGAIAA